jgi:chromosome segregation ATPase
LAFYSFLSVFLARQHQRNANPRGSARRSHQLRQDLHALATQTLIYRLYVREAVVAPVAERFDQAESAVDQFEARKKWETLQLKEYEEGKDSAQSPAERRQLEDAISNLKSQIAAWTAHEQEAQAKKMEVAEQLRIEQAKLDQLQNELDQIDQSLRNASARPAAANG